MTREALCLLMQQQQQQTVACCLYKSVRADQPIFQTLPGGEVLQEQNDLHVLYTDIMQS